MIKENESEILDTINGVVELVKYQDEAIDTAYREICTIIKQINLCDSKYDNIIEYLKQPNTEFTETPYSVNAVALYSNEILLLCNKVFGNRCFKQMDDNNGTACKNIIIDWNIKC